MVLGKVSRKLLCIAALALAATALPASADDIAQAGRQITTKWQDAVVTVHIVVKTTMSFEGEEDEKEESKLEAVGTVIDPSGLIVMSLSASDPAEAMDRMMPGEMEGFKVTSEITDMKIILSNGKELPAAVVLRDKDLDLAFIRPKQKPAQPLTAVDLVAVSKPGLLDQVVILYRLGTVGSRVIAACTDRVQSIIEKPRTFYSMGLPAMGASLGSPVFAVDSNAIGLLLLRAAPGGISDSSPSSSGIGGMGVMYVVLPAADVLEAAKQAPAEVK